MSTEIIRKLTELSTILDKKGRYDEANELDEIINAFAKKEKSPKKPPKKYREGGATKRSDYADPENYKYPIDTEAHVRAAISYFSKPANANKYSKSKQSSIWAKIRAAAKKYKIEISDKSGPPSQEKKKKSTKNIVALMKMANAEQRIEELMGELDKIDESLKYSAPEVQGPELQRKKEIERQIEWLMDHGDEPVVLPDIPEETSEDVTGTIEDWFVYGDRIKGVAASLTKEKKESIQEGWAGQPGRSVATSPIVSIDGDIAVTYSGSRYKLGMPNRNWALRVANSILFE